MGENVRKKILNYLPVIFDSWTIVLDEKFFKEG